MRLWLTQLAVAAEPHPLSDMKRNQRLRPFLRIVQPHVWQLPLQPDEMEEEGEGDDGGVQVDKHRDQRRAGDDEHLRLRHHLPQTTTRCQLRLLAIFVLVKSAKNKMSSTHEDKRPNVC